MSRTMCFWHTAKVAVYGGWVDGVVVAMVIRAFLFARSLVRSGGHPPPSQQLWCVSVCVCAFVRSCVRVFVCSCVFVRSCLRVFVCVRSPPSPPSLHIHVFLSIYLFIYIYISNRAAHPRPYICIYNVFLYIYIYICICICICIYLYFK